MPRSWIAGLAGLAFIAPAPAMAVPADPVLGDWMVPGDGVKVRIAACAGDANQVCGDMVWLKHGVDKAGKPLLDSANPDPALRARPWLGMPFITGFTRDAPGRWSGGRIYDPDSGKTYRSRMRINADGTLKLEGCVLVFCQAQTWKHATF